MKSSVLLAAATLLALPCGAMADAAGNASTRARVVVRHDPQPKVADFPGDDDWFRLELDKGQDVYVSSDCTGCRLALRDFTGKVLAQGSIGSDWGGGFSYVAPYKGLYFVEALDLKDAYGYPEPYGLTVTGDCNGECVILPGQTRYGRIVDGLDRDAFTAPLVAGRSYTFTLQDPDGDEELDLTGPAGDALWCCVFGSTTFTAPATGPYLVGVGHEGTKGGGPYALSLSAGAAARR